MVDMHGPRRRHGDRLHRALNASLMAGMLAMVLTVITPALTASADWEAPPGNAKWDYQIGGDYPLPRGVRVVSRDWFSGEAPDTAYGICYVNAFQTQADEDDVDRPDEQSNWPQHLVLTELGDDPNWGGEYLIDISTEKKRQEAAAYVRDEMTATCASKGFEGVEFDNLDSWTRFDGTPVANQVPFEREDAVAYAALLVADAHDLGLAAAQKNTAALSKHEAREVIGFDFAIAEECIRWKECGRYRANYGKRVFVIEYRKKDYRQGCKKKKMRKRYAIILRDINVTTPDSPTYRYRAC